MRLSGKWGGSWRTGGPGVPLLSSADAAREFGITRHQLAGYLGAHDGPKPVDTVQSTTDMQMRYYKAAELRKWWKGVKHA